MLLPPPRSPLFPYTTLFRSGEQFGQLGGGVGHEAHRKLLDRRLALRAAGPVVLEALEIDRDRKSTRLNSSHLGISYAVFCLKKKKTDIRRVLCRHKR